MKRFKIETGLLLVILFTLCSCNKERNGISAESGDFEEKTRVGLVIDGSYAVLYNRDISQYVYNVERRSIRFQADDHSSYVNAILLEHPKNTPQLHDIVNIEIVYKEQHSPSQTKMVLPMALIKQQNGIYWLWNEVTKIGLIVDWTMFERI